ncbi:MAG: hypothetical protein ACRD0L_14275, partial [Acidimicrobiales bacterium]
MLAAALAVVLVFPLLAPAKPARADTIASKRAQAAQLAAEIQAEGNRVNALSEAYDAARIKVSQVEDQVSAAKAAVAKTGRRVTWIEAHLRKEAIEAWVGQGNGVSTVQSLLEGNVNSLGIRQQYLDAVTGNQQATVDSLHIARRAEQAKQAVLESAESQAKAALSSVANDRQQAIQATDQLEATLGRVKGQLAQLVAAAQARAAAAREAAARAA